METPLDKDTLFFRWNEERPLPGEPWFHDETLRDGLQAPSVRNPQAEEKCIMLEYSAAVGCRSACVGFPASSERNFHDCAICMRHIYNKQLPLIPDVICRTAHIDVDETIKLHREVGLDMEVLLFVGSSPIRHLVEKWEPKRIEAAVRETVRRCKQDGMRVVFASEDTTRSTKEMIQLLFGGAIEEGADVCCIADTVGYSTPEGTRNIVRFMKEVIKEREGLVNHPVSIDFHGHMDRGLGLPNSMIALQEGCRCHGTILGLGERSGNTPIDQLIVNVHLDQDYYGGFTKSTAELNKLKDYVQYTSRVTQTPIPYKYPVMGCDSFATMTGIHAAAILKAKEMGDEHLADVVYSAVPARTFGIGQQVTIGPDSGHWNVDHWLKSHNVERTPEHRRKILQAAKNKRTILTEGEVWESLGDGKRAKFQLEATKKGGEPLLAEAEGDLS